MGFEVWIAIVLVASGLSGGIGYALARRGAPRRSEFDALTAELEAARSQAESVQSGVSEHFEQSALLFGKLAADYREFLDHFSASARNLGLSEARARELIEQGFQPLLTDDSSAGPVVAQAQPMDVPGDPEAADTPSRPSEVTVDMPEPGISEDVLADTAQSSDAGDAGNEVEIPSASGEGPETEGPETEGPETESLETDVPETEVPETRDSERQRAG